MGDASSYMIVYDTMNWSCSCIYFTREQKSVSNINLQNNISPILFESFPGIGENYFYYNQ